MGEDGGGEMGEGRERQLGGEYGGRRGGRWGGREK